MKRYHVILSGILACTLLAGCSATIANPPAGALNAESASTALDSPTPIAQALEGIAYSGDTLTDEQKAAAEQLYKSGVLTEADLSDDSLKTVMTRARFIELLVKALALPVSAPESGSLNEIYDTSYARYVQAGYSAGLFANSETTMSFTPTDGFFMGERSYSDMEKPMSRYDTAVVFANLLTGTAEECSFQDDSWLSQKNETVRRAVFLCVNAGILFACEDGSFHGDSSMTLAQTAQALCRFIQCDISIADAPQAAGDSALEALQKSRRVIHAGGRYLCEDNKSRRFTNSAEALLNSYRAGYRAIEIDITFTADGHLACIRDWLHEYSRSISDGVALSMAEWIDTRVRGSLTPLCAESLAEFMREHPDLYIVTNTKQNGIAIAQELARICPDVKDQFIIQIYKDSEYEQIKSIGFKNIIYTMDDLSKDDKIDFEHLASFAASHPLVGYTYPLSYFETDGYNEGIASTGIPLFVHTVNDEDQRQACYAAGITAVYTDDVA